MTDARLSPCIFIYLSRGGVGLFFPALLGGLEKMHRCPHPTLLAITSAIISSSPRCGGGTGSDRAQSARRDFACRLSSFGFFAARCAAATFATDLLWEKILVELPPVPASLDRAAFLNVLWPVTAKASGYEVIRSACFKRCLLFIYCSQMEANE